MEVKHLFFVLLLASVLHRPSISASVPSDQHVQLQSVSTDAHNGTPLLSILARQSDDGDPCQTEKDALVNAREKVRLCELLLQRAAKGVSELVRDVMEAEQDLEKVEDQYSEAAGEERLIRSALRAIEAELRRPNPNEQQLVRRRAELERQLQAVQRDRAAISDDLDRVRAVVRRKRAELSDMIEKVQDQETQLTNAEVISRNLAEDLVECEDNS